MKVGKTWIVYLGIDHRDYEDEGDTLVVKRSLVMGKALGSLSSDYIALTSEFREWKSDSEPILAGTHSSCDYRIDSTKFQPFHFIIYFNQQGVFIEDLTQGLPGIKVNGLKCIGAKPITADSVITVRDVEIDLTVHGSLKKRCADLFTKLNNKTQLTLTRLDAHEATPFQLGPVGSRLSIGRSKECNLCVQDPSMSRCHAYLIIRDKRILLEDNKSSNKCYVNLKAMTKATLHPGDIVEMGGSTFLVHYEESP